MEYTVIIILLSLLQYTYFSYLVGVSRGKYEVKAPKTSGNDIWERSFRVHQNTMEQLVIFIPGMLAFGVYVSSTWVAVPGIAFLIGRQLYAHFYVQEPSKRKPGALLTFLANMLLVLGSLIGIGLQLAG